METPLALRAWLGRSRATPWTPSGLWALGLGFGVWSLGFTGHMGDLTEVLGLYN